MKRDFNVCKGQPSIRLRRTLSAARSMSLLRADAPSKLLAVIIVAPLRVLLMKPKPPVSG